VTPTATPTALPPPLLPPLLPSPGVVVVEAATAVVDVIVVGVTVVVAVVVVVVTAVVVTAVVVTAVADETVPIEFTLLGGAVIAVLTVTTAVLTVTAAVLTVTAAVLMITEVLLVAITETVSIPSEPDPLPEPTFEIPLPEPTFEIPLPEPTFEIPLPEFNPDLLPAAVAVLDIVIVDSNSTVSVWGVKKVYITKWVWRNSSLLPTSFSAGIV